jgi:hypothetical protein
VYGVDHGSASDEAALGLGAPAVLGARAPACDARHIGVVNVLSWRYANARGLRIGAWDGAALGLGAPAASGARATFTIIFIGIPGRDVECERSGNFYAEYEQIGMSNVDVYDNFMSNVNVQES